MTPKEKARELVERFNRVNEATGSFITEFQVKQCALICVDEIIKELMDDEWTERYWRDIKEEILK